MTTLEKTISGCAMNNQNHNDNAAREAGQIEKAYAEYAAGALSDGAACEKYGVTQKELIAEARRQGSEENAKWMERSLRIETGTATRADGEDDYDEDAPIQD